MKIAVFWGGRHTLPGNCDLGTWYSFYNSGWKYGFETLGHTVDYFAWDDTDSHPGYDLYVYAPGFLTNKTFHKKLHKPNVFFTEEASFGVSWGIAHSFYYDHVCTLDLINYQALVSNGVKNAHWVPGAVDPTIFKLDHQYDSDKRVYNATFLGSYDSEVKITANDTRLDYIRAIDAANKPSMVANGFYSFEANKIWNVSKIGVDVPIVEFVSFRLFQIIASGAFCVTRKPRVETGLETLMLPYCYDLYESIDDLTNNVIPNLLRRDNIRVEGAKAARDFVIKNHTFKNRAEQLLQIVGLS